LISPITLSEVEKNKLIYQLSYYNSVSLSETGSKPINLKTCVQAIEETLPLNPNKKI
jgi:hypothetical protein